MMLYVVSTPIGNMSDLSPRASKTIIEADVILAEDTRKIAKILNFLGLSVKDKKVISCNERCSDNKIAKIFDQYSSSNKVVFCSDAGTPNVSDPGGKVVQEALSRGFKVIPVPGPSALTALISVSPFSCNKFIFNGYFPKKKGRLNVLKTIEQAEHPIFFFESPYRIIKTLRLLQDNLDGQYHIIIGRELTKYFEEVIFSDLASLNVETIKTKGEFVFGIKRV